MHPFKRQIVFKQNIVCNATVASWRLFCKQMRSFENASCGGWIDKKLELFCVKQKKVSKRKWEMHLPFSSQLSEEEEDMKLSFFGEVLCLTLCLVVHFPSRSIVVCQLWFCFHGNARPNEILLASLNKAKRSHSDFWDGFHDGPNLCVSFNSNLQWMFVFWRQASSTLFRRIVHMRVWERSTRKPPSFTVCDATQSAPNRQHSSTSMCCIITRQPVNLSTAIEPATTVASRRAHNSLPSFFWKAKCDFPPHHSFTMPLTTVVGRWVRFPFVLHCFISLLVLPLVLWFYATRIITRSHMLWQFWKWQDHLSTRVTRTTQKMYLHSAVPYASTVHSCDGHSQFRSYPIAILGYLWAWKDGCHHSSGGNFGRRIYGRIEWWTAEITLVWVDLSKDDIFRVTPTTRRQDQGKKQPARTASIDCIGWTFCRCVTTTARW